MLEKLITNFKKSLPESLSKMLGGANNSDGEEEADEVADIEDEETESEAAPAENGEEEKNKKMKSMIIKVIVILGLGYFALDEFILKDMQQKNGTNAVVKNVSAKVKKKVEAKVEEKVEVEAPPTDISVSSEEVAPVTEIKEVPPIENVNVLEKTNGPALETPIDQSDDEVIPETKVGEKNVDQNLDQLVESMDETQQKNPIEEVKVPSSGEVADPPSMASRIVEGVTETPPPAYDQIGRGLVYNCKDKYWACLDKPAYVTCNKNQKWNKSKGNSAECVVADVYSSEEDCAKVQKYNVSTSAPTAFCQD